MITLSELILCLKFGRELFGQTQLGLMVLWLVLLVTVSCGGLVVSVRLWRWRHARRQGEGEQEVQVDSQERVQLLLGKSEQLKLKKRKPKARKE